MKETEIIYKYFPNLSDKQKEQFGKMMDLYPEWNQKINVISRKDIDNLEVNHILHSLAIAKFLNFSADTKVLDLGTGGGFPGLPLAVMFPEVHFHLVDRIGKKLKVVADVIEQLGLKNVTFQHGDIGECHEEFDFVVSRAVMDMPDIVRLTRKNIRQGGKNAVFNGWLILKGGELDAELGKLSAISETVDLSMWFEEPFFSTKKLIYTPRR